MALIGSIAISMTTRTDQLRKGLAQGGAMVQSWGAGMTASLLSVGSVAAKVGGLMGGAFLAAGADMIRSTAKLQGTATEFDVFGRLVSNSWMAIGEVAAPIVQAAMEGINWTVGLMQVAWEDVSAVVSEWFTSTTEALGVTDVGTKILAASVQVLASAWNVVKAAATAAFALLETAIAKIADGLAWVLESIEWIGGGEWAGKAAGYLREYSAAAKQIADSSWEISKAATHDLLLGSPAAIETMNSYFDRATKRVAEVRKEVEKPLHAQVQFASAARRGSAEAASTVLRNRFGSRHSKDAAIAQNTQQTAQHTKEMVGVGKGIVAAVGALKALPIVNF